MDETKKDQSEDTSKTSGPAPVTSAADASLPETGPSKESPITSVVPSAKKTADVDIAAEVGLPPRTASVPDMQRTPGTPQTNAIQDSAISSDIARILEEVKLPERNEFRGQADKIPRSPVQPQEPIIEKTPAPAPAPEKDSIVTPLHTLKDDLQSVVRDQKISVVRVAALEEDRRAKQKSLAKTDVHSVQRRRIGGILVTIFVLVILGFAAIVAVFMIQKERSGSDAARQASESLLFSEQTVPFPIQNRAAPEIKRMFADARVTAALTLGAITQIAPTVEDIEGDNGIAYTRSATTQEFLRSIGAHAPDELLRALDTEFFFGFHTVDENAPLFVIPVSAYERAFAGMLEWENSMNADLSPIFTTLPALIQEDGLLKKRPFEDLVMRNYDVRALKDDSGEIQLYYSFPTRELLIIAESPYSFTEILSRLRADRRI